MATEQITLLGFGLAWFVILLIILIGLALWVFWIWMIVDCVKRDFKNDGDKIVWILVLVFLGMLGSIIYFFVIKNKDSNR